MPAQTIELEVPFISQRMYGAHADYKAKRVEEGGCWFAAISMIGFFWEPGPRKGVPRQYKTWNGKVKENPDGMHKRYEELKKNENLSGVVLPGEKKWTVEQLADLVSRRGPCYVRRGYVNENTGKLEGGHIIVLTGANIGHKMVCCLDPWEEEELKGRRVYSIDEFNGFFKWVEHRQGISMMYKKRDDQDAAIAHINSKKKSNWNTMNWGN